MKLINISFNLLNNISEEQKEQLKDVINIINQKIKRHGILTRNEEQLYNILNSDNLIDQLDQINLKPYLTGGQRKTKKNVQSGGNRPEKVIQIFTYENNNFTEEVNDNESFDYYDDYVNDSRSFIEAELRRGLVGIPLLYNIYEDEPLEEQEIEDEIYRDGTMTRNGYDDFSETEEEFSETEEDLIDLENDFSERRTSDAVDSIIILSKNNVKSNVLEFDTTLKRILMEAANTSIDEVIEYDQEMGNLFERYDQVEGTVDKSDERKEKVEFVRQNVKTKLSPELRDEFLVWLNKNNNYADVWFKDIVNEQKYVYNKVKSHKSLNSVMEVKMFFLWLVGYEHRNNYQFSKKVFYKTRKYKSIYNKYKELYQAYLQFIDNKEKAKNLQKILNEINDPIITSLIIDWLPSNNNYNQKFIKWLKNIK